MPTDTHNALYAARWHAQILRGLAHPLRLRIVDLLTSGPLCVGDIAAALDVKPAAVSQHLAPLRMLQLVHARRDAAKVYYHLAKPELRQMLDCLRRCAPPNHPLSEEHP